MAAPNATSFHDPSLGDCTVITTGRFVAGVHGAPSRETRERLLGQLAARLSAKTKSR